MTRPRSTIYPLIGLAVLLASGCDRFVDVETRVARATASLEAGDYQSALVDVRKALEDESNNVEAQLLLVDVLEASGETPAALAQLNRAKEAGAPPAETDVRLIRLLLSAGDRRAAEDALTSANATLAPAQRDLLSGRLALQQQKPADAQVLFDRALTADPGLLDAALGRIESISAQGNIKEALDQATALSVSSTGSSRPWLYKGTLSAQLGDCTSAIEAFTKVIDQHLGLNQLSLIQAHAQRIECYLATQQPQMAQQVLPALEAAAGNSVIVSLMRSKIALTVGDATTAVNELRKFTQAIPRNLDGRLLLAEALFQQGSTEQAFAEAVRSVAEFGDRDQPRLSLASLELRLGRTADSEETLRPLLTRPPPNPLAVSMLAEMQIRRGESVAGVALLERSVAERPEDAQLKLQLAAAYLSTGDAQRALSVLEMITDKELAAARDRLRVVATAVMKDPATAAVELETAITRNPKDVDLLLMAAAFQSSTGRLDSARTYLQKAREIRPSDPTLTLTLGRIELSLNRVAEAEDLARGVLDKAPNDAAAMTLMAGIAAQRGQDAEVDGWLGRARIAKPDALDVRLALARRAFARGKNLEARDLLQEAVRNAPTDPAPLIALAELNASIGQFVEAMGSLQQAARLQPDSPFILLAMAKVQLASDQQPAARQSLNKALELVPGWLPAATTLAALEVSTNNLPAALAIVRDLRRIDPKGSASFALEGDVFIAANRPADAATAFATAYRREPSALLATRAAQVKRATKQGDPESELIDWVARTPADALARRTLAEYHMAAGRNSAAIAELEKVAAARPNDAIALNNLAWLYQQNSDDRAVSTAEKAYAAAPNAAAVADTYGWILVQRGEMEKGSKALGRASELAPGDNQIQYHFAHALSVSGDRERARAILRQILTNGKAFESLSDAQKLLSTLDGAK